MRIAVVHSFYSDQSPSGENTVVRDQAAALRYSGHDVLLIARETDRESTRHFHHLRAATAAANLGGPSPAKRLQQFQPDVVHVHNLFPNWGTRWLADWGERTVVTLHNYRTLCAAGTLWRDGHDCTDCLSSTSLEALKNRCYRNSVVATAPLAFAARGQGQHQPVLRYPRALVVLNSRSMEILERRALSPIFIVPNFAPEPETTDAQTTGDLGEYWTFVGRLTPEKGIMQAIDALPAGETLVVVGDGPLSDKVQEASRRPSNSVRFVGRLPHREVAGILAGSKGLIIPSLWSEGIPTAALEALSVGTPLVVSSQCASASELTRNSAGIVFDMNDSGTSLPPALMAIANEPGKFRAAARALHHERYSPAAWVQQIENVYRTSHR